MVSSAISMSTTLKIRVRRDFFRRSVLRRARAMAVSTGRL